MKDKMCEVIFVDDDRVTILERKQVKKGEKATYTGPKPTKEPTAFIKYEFVGWTNEEKLDNITESITFFAKYACETLNETKDEKEFYDASLENAENTKLNDSLEAGKKITEQQNALEKDTRTTEEIISDILDNGKTEVGNDINKDVEKNER